MKELIKKLHLDLVKYIVDNETNPQDIKSASCLIDEQPE